jgi:mRNA interferase RelE/StbE
MTWTIKLDDSTRKTLSKLDRSSQKEILKYLHKTIATLEHPRQLGKALRDNLKGLWRYRVDKFRIICKIQDEQLIVLVIKIGKRDEIYCSE